MFQCFLEKRIKLVEILKCEMDFGELISSSKKLLRHKNSNYV